MLTDIFSVLYDHVSQLGLPCYLADCVPKGAVLPYLTADIQPSLRLGTAGTLTLTCWHTEETSNTQRLSHADQMEALIPRRGLWLAADSGSITLIPEGGMQCITQHSAQGVVFHFQLYFFANT